MTKVKFLIVVAISAILCSCSEFNRLQKSTDPDVKFEAGKIFFQEKKYIKSATMFESIITFYRGTPKAEELLYLLSESYMGQNDFFAASEYFSTYLRSFPRGEYADEARFKVAYCYYLDSQDPRLDQSSTYAAIVALYEFIDLYPTSDRVESCYRYLAEMENKLAYKGLMAAKLYFNLGTYGGNNFQAAVLTAENTLKEYPDSKYRDDLLFLILQSKSDEASNSIDDKKVERYSEVIDEYYRYANEFSDGKNIKAANRILKEAKNIVK
ncbi:MAG: outer membrane protein assembly factor BamD [bacterium]